MIRTQSLIRVLTLRGQKFLLCVDVVGSIVKRFNFREIKPKVYLLITFYCLSSFLFLPKYILEFRLFVCTLPSCRNARKTLIKCRFAGPEVS